VSLKINNYAGYISKWREGHGFFTPKTFLTEGEREAMLGKLMLVVTEISEAAEEVRHNDPIKFAREIGDAFVRLMDIVGTMEIDIDSIITKDIMPSNESRPVKHGKKCSL
jgi:NTP pyrophosphatase (non-canonical NTP hydrolase)